MDDVDWQDVTHVDARSAALDHAAACVELVLPKACEDLEPGAVLKALRKPAQKKNASVLRYARTVVQAVQLVVIASRVAAVLAVLQAITATG